METPYLQGRPLALPFHLGQALPPAQAQGGRGLLPSRFHKEIQGWLQQWQHQQEGDVDEQGQGFGIGAGRGRGGHESVNVDGGGGENGVEPDWLCQVVTLHGDGHIRSVSSMLVYQAQDMDRDLQQTVEEGSEGWNGRGKGGESGHGMGELCGRGGGQGGGRGLHRVRRMRKDPGEERRKERRREKSPDGELLQGYFPSAEKCKKE